MPILPVKNKKVNKGIEATNNKYILTQYDKPYINLSAVEVLMNPLPSPIISSGDYKIAGSKLFMYDKTWGLDFFTKQLNLNQEITEEALEDYILQAASLYLYKELDKFPPEDQEKLDMSPEDFEDPDDMPPIDKGLDEIGINTKDFKL